MKSDLFYVDEQIECNIIRTRKMEVHLSRKNGCIIEIKDLRTGKTICTTAADPGNERLFELIAVRHIDFTHTCDARHQKKVDWEITPESVSIIYPELVFDGERSDCSAVVDISCAAKGGLLFQLHVENSGDDPIHTIRFPMLPGWQNRKTEEPFVLTGGAKWQSKLGQKDKISVNYPSFELYMPWLDISDSKTGLSMINYMERPYVGGIGGSKSAAPGKDPQECYWWNHYPLIRKGIRWSSPPVGVDVHNGDWHITADRYYEWFNENVGISLKQPASLRTSIGFQNIDLRSSVWNSPENMPVGHLCDYVRKAKEYGIRHFSIWDFMSMGAYLMYVHDVDLLDYSPDEKESLKKAVDEIKKEGVMISALVNFRHINVKHDLYETFRSEAVLCLDGSEQRECWTTPYLGGNLMLISPRSPMMKKRIEDLLDKYLELGYNAIFYDQPFLYSNHNIGLDYNHMGKENRPDDACSALYDIIAHVRSRLQALDPEAYTIGEQFNIFSASRSLDMQMEWNFTNTGIESLARVLYACPHTLLSYVIDGKEFGETHASHAFAAGLLLCIRIEGGTGRFIGEGDQHDVSPLAEHIGRLAKLREKTASRMAYGRFRHNQGLTLSGSERITAYSYDSAQGPAVALAAGAKGGPARIRLDLSRFQTPSDRIRGKLYLITGETIDVNDGDHLEYDLGPDQVAVWYC